MRPAIDRADQQILEHGELFERLRDLAGAADAGAATLAALALKIAAVEADDAGVLRELAGDQVEQRGLARPVRPDDADRLARCDR